MTMTNDYDYDHFGRRAELHLLDAVVIVIVISHR